MRIADVVHLSRVGEFTNDVQLRWYTDKRPENVALANRYMFTRTSAGERKSPVDILYQIKQAFLLDTYENRFTIIATYGHGKSHLALALANYFGRPAESKEVKALLKSIRCAFHDDPEAEAYADFKTERKRHLVVCVEGTRVGDLSHLFLHALQKALNNEPATANLSLPFWTEEAQRIVQKIEGQEGMAAAANAFLKQQDLDLKALGTRLRDQDVSLYDTVRELCRHLYDHVPDLGGPIDLHRVVEWVAGKLCGPEDDKPFSGLLILFDEFSAFIRNYAIRRTPGTPLQDLLDGVSGCKGRVVFAGFGQSDPDSSVFSVFSDRPDDLARSALLLELERLPKSFRFQLYTTMEAVLDSYLSQDKKQLCDALVNSNSLAAVTDANDDSLILFRRRYESELKWNAEKYQEIVTLGCFPLHPLTATLLCNIQLIESATPRSVLGFVSEHVKTLADTEIADDGKPTWIRAIELVDWFGKQLADDEWNRYDEAVRQRGGDATPEELAVLKAMLLHFIAQMPTKEVSFTTAIAHLTGLSAKEIASTLKTLADAAIIDYTRSTNKYSFWPLGGGARLLQERVNHQVCGRSMTWEQWRKVNSGQIENGLSRTSVSVSWGHADDWAAPQFYLPHDEATAERVRELASDHRGCVIWCVARLDSDVDWFEKNASSLFSCVGKSKTPLPVVLVLPSRPSRSLVEALHRQLVLKSLSQQEILQFGSHVVEVLKAEAEKAVKKDALILFTTRKRWCIPAAYAAVLRMPPEPTSVDAVAQRLYDAAYTDSPKYFYTQYKASNSNLKNGVTTLCKLLLNNEVHTGKYEGNKLAVGLVDNFLVVGKSTSWGLLSLEKRLQEPQANHTMKAWTVLNKQVPDDGSEADLRPAMRALLEPPYGYDHNTLSLLFCSWYGYHRHDLSLSLHGAVAGVEELIEEIDKTPAPASFINLFTNATLSVRISRRNRSKASKEIMDIVQRVQHLWQNPLTKLEAHDVIVKLDDYRADERNPDTEKKRAEETKAAILAALQVAAKYDQNVSSLLKDAGTSKDVGKLVRLLERVGEMQPSSGVITEQPRLDDVRAKVEHQLSCAVEEFCHELERLPDITHYEAYREKLQGTQRLLEDYTDIQNRIAEALKALDEAKESLVAEGRDSNALRMLDLIATTGSLAQMRGNLIKAGEVPCLSEKTKLAQREKVDELERAIAGLEEFAANVKDTVASVESQQQLRQVHKTLNERRALFTGTPELQQIDAAGEACEQLESFFQVLSQLKPGSFQTKSEQNEVIRRIEDLPSQYGQVLGEAQQRVISSVKTECASRTTLLQKEAAKWLDRVEAEVGRSKDLQSLLQKLDNPPEFLEAANQAKVDMLRANIAQRLEEARQEEELRRKDDVQLSALRTISTQGPLKELRENLKLIIGMEFATKKAQVEQAKKKEAIEKAIAALVSFAEELKARIDLVTNNAALEKVKTSISERKLMFKGSPEMAHLDVALDRCLLIEDLLADISLIKDDSFESLAEYEATTARVIELRKTCGKQLSASQTELLSKAEANIESRYQKLGAQAEKWFSEAQATFKKGRNLDRLLEELKSPPVFLPKTKQSHLDKLKTDVEAAFANDLYSQIICLFKKIGRKSVQKQVVDELGAIIRGQSTEAN